MADQANGPTRDWLGAQSKGLGFLSPKAALADNGRYWQEGWSDIKELATVIGQVYVRTNAAIKAELWGPGRHGVAIVAWVVGGVLGTVAAAVVMIVGVSAIALINFCKTLFRDIIVVVPIVLIALTITAAVLFPVEAGAAATAALLPAAIVAIVVIGVAALVAGSIAAYKNPDKIRGMCNTISTWHDGNMKAFKKWGYESQLKAIKEPKFGFNAETMLMLMDRPAWVIQANGKMMQIISEAQDEGIEITINKWIMKVPKTSEEKTIEALRTAGWRPPNAADRAFLEQTDGGVGRVEGDGFTFVADAAFGAEPDESVRLHRPRTHGTVGLGGGVGDGGDSAAAAAAAGTSRTHRSKADAIRGGGGGGGGVGLGADAAAADARPVALFGGSKPIDPFHQGG